ncbi:hypothetical protein BpHYR1_026542 [Brachionus plicatilis]|uniref:Uncharacterized protein n=1 Tax=Brachionus plicatilis TaxID=10195 RepID=A0A3M7P806_BRAPC|nr:hypothetical protein BpHYR1_026542 [Brachionus plicatilis]
MGMTRGEAMVKAKDRLEWKSKKLKLFVYNSKYNFIDLMINKTFFQVNRELQRCFILSNIGVKCRQNNFTKIKYTKKSKGAKTEQILMPQILKL